MVGAARAAMDLLAVLGSATLAISAVVLGASMFPPDDAVSHLATSSGTAAADAGRGPQCISYSGRRDHSM